MDSDMAKKSHKKKPTPIVEEKVSDNSLAKSQKIPLTRENFILLKNFVTGKFPESYGEPYERLKITPEVCPYCRFSGGWDYTSGAIIDGPTYATSKDAFRQNRVVPVACLSCGSVYRVTESWLIYFEVEEPVLSNIG